MARRKHWATAAFAIAGVLCTLAFAKAATEDGPQWPTIYEPKWPMLPDASGARPENAKPENAKPENAKPQSARPQRAKPERAKPERATPDSDKPEPLREPEPVITGSVPPASPVAQRWHNFEKAPPPPPISAISGEFGLRYWFSWNKTAKNLYDIPGSALVSRLTYDKMHGHSAEGFGRVDHTSGFFIKGTVGAGILVNGQLKDEDFPPFIAPYSSTDSEQRDGHLAYASVDFGFNLIRQKGLRVGAFAGYHYLDQEVNAYGCMQAATNPAICGGGIGDDIKVISQNNQWHSLRIGLDADIRLAERLSLKLDAAWLPYVKLNGSDSHWLRICAAPGCFAGPIPEDGQGTGYQLQAALAWAASPHVNFAAGIRYWRMDTEGLTHFEGNVVGANALPQPVDWRLESVGVFLQASFKFGPYPTGMTF